MQLNISKYLYMLNIGDYVTAYDDLNNKKDIVIAELKEKINETTATYIVNSFLFLAKLMQDKNNIIAIDDYIDLSNIDVKDLDKDTRLKDIIGITLLVFYYILDEGAPIIETEHPIMKLDTYSPFVLNKYIYNDNIKNIMLDWLSNFEDATDINYCNIYNHLSMFLEKFCFSSSTISPE